MELPRRSLGRGSGGWRAEKQHERERGSWVFCFGRGMESVQSVPLRLLVVFLLGVSKCISLQITGLSIPSFVKNGSEESVVLDCEYTYDIKEVEKLVVKWYHEDDPLPVYQWITELNQKSYSDKFNFDEDYTVPQGTKYTRSRAISIQRPTTELSGTYRCEVQTLESSDNMEDTMTVYAHPTSVEVHVNYTSEDGMLKVMCEVENVFPLPELSLFQIKPGAYDKSPLNETELEYELIDGAYDVEFSTTIPESELDDGQTFFGCNVDMNGTDYSKEFKIPYVPSPVAEKHGSDDSDDDGSSTIAGFEPLIIFLSVLLLSLT